MPGFSIENFFVHNPTSDLPGLPEGAHAGSVLSIGELSIIAVGHDCGLLYGLMLKGNGDVALAPVPLWSTREGARCWLRTAEYSLNERCRLSGYSSHELVSTVLLAANALPSLGDVSEDRIRRFWDVTYSKARVYAALNKGLLRGQSTSSPSPDPSPKTSVKPEELLDDAPSVDPVLRDAIVRAFQNLR